MKTDPVVAKERQGDQLALAFCSNSKLSFTLPTRRSFRSECDRLMWSH